MNNTNSNEEIINNTVQSVGSSWIVCKSKSRIGHVYYFNTLTGETVWNLCDSEIEKAKNNKKQLGTHLAKSPEPKEQPPADLSVQCSKIARSSMRQTTQINQTSSQQMSNSPFPHFLKSNSSYVNRLDNFTASNALSKLTVDPNNGFNRSINSLNFNNMTSMFNPNVWAVPQQIFITPNMSPLVNQAQNSLNIGYNNIHHTIAGEHISTPTFTNYEVTNQLGNRPTRKTINNNKNKFRNFGQRRQVFNKYKTSGNRNDLRTKISVNRRFHCNRSSTFTPRPHTFGNRDQKSNASFNRQGFVVDESSKKILYDETTSRLDLTPLKNMAAANVEDNWFIVVDMDVILNDFKFLNILSDSDAQCHLVVPQHVMAALEHYVATSQDIQARRIQRFLFQQIDHGDVMIAEESYESEDVDDTGNLILSTCFKLSEENYHLVLLTNDSELLSYKDSIPITIFSPFEAKRLLNLNPSKSNLTNTKATFTLNRPFKNVQNIPESDSNVSIIINTDNGSISSTPPKVNKECGTDPIITPEPTKTTMDAAIQTDFSDISPTSEIESSNITKDMQKQTRDIVKTMEKRSNVGTVTCVSADNLNKKRIIRLKRTTSNVPPVAPSKNDEKRNLKWRRRRIPLSQAKETVTDNIVPENKDKITVTEDLPEDILSNSNVIKEKSIESKPQDVVGTSDISVVSSDVSIVKQNVSDYNIVIEETSTSGISNTASNVDIETVNSKRQWNNQFDLENEDKEIKTVLYGVDSPNMEEYLVMKCDEWVSRFIQIMEEALTVVLQHDPPFSHDSLPPPWTMYEAAQCVKMKFRTNNAINDATYKLSDILLRVSDHRGKINTNITPSDYMEMYSYGVYLLDTITAVVENCEDLQIGVESLKKLLRDIQNPNLDNSTQETFTDVSQDHASVNVSSGTNSESCFRTPEKGLSPQKLQSKREKYNLRSGRKRRFFQEDADNSNPVKVVRNLNPESSFFTSLKLQKKINFGNCKNVEENTSNDKRLPKDVCNIGNTEENNFKTGENRDESRVRSEHGNDLKKSETSITSGIKFSSCDSNKTSKEIDLDENGPTKSPEPLKDLNNSNHSDKPDKIEDNLVNEPRIILNFTKCPKFEEKLKQRIEEEVESQVDSELDYEEDYDDEYLTEEYGPEDEFNESSGHDEGNIEMDESEQTAVKSPKEAEITSNNNNNKNKFQYVIQIILQEIRDAFYAVKNICENYFEESKTPQGPKMKRIELRIKVKNASVHINDLCNSLDSMLKREANHSNNNIEALFRKAGFQDFHIDDELKAEYRDTITKCKNYAGVFLECITNILSTLNC